MIDAGDVLADQFPQITLPGHEADDRHGPFGLPRLDQLGELVPFGLDEVQVRRVRGEPEDKFVEEQDQTVKAERLGMSADDAQADIEIDVGFVLARGDALEGREDVLNQIADEASPFLTGRRCFHRRFKPGGVPAPGELAPAGLFSLPPGEA